MTPSATPPHITHPSNGIRPPVAPHRLSFWTHARITPHKLELGRAMPARHDHNWSPPEFANHSPSVCALGSLNKNRSRMGHERISEQPSARRRKSVIARRELIKILLNVVKYSSQDKNGAGAQWNSRRSCPDASPFHNLPDASHDFQLLTTVCPMPSRPGGKKFLFCLPPQRAQMT